MSAVIHRIAHSPSPAPATPQITSNSAAPRNQGALAPRSNGVPASFAAAQATDVGATRAVSAAAAQNSKPSKSKGGGITQFEKSLQRFVVGTLGFGALAGAGAAVAGGIAAGASPLLIGAGVVGLGALGIIGGAAAINWLLFRDLR